MLIKATEQILKYRKGSVRSSMKFGITSNADQYYLYRIIKLISENIVTLSSFKILLVSLKMESLH